MDFTEETGMDAPERRQTHVSSELEEQPQLLSAIQQDINELDKRLVGVLVGEDQTEKRNVTTSEPRITLVPVAEQIHDNNDKLRWIHQRLVSLLDRLEL